MEKIELISCNHHNNNCALFTYIDKGKRLYKKMAFDLSANVTIQNEYNGYKWYYNNINKQINFNIEKRLLYELKIPAYEGENYSPDSEYSMYASLIDNIIDHYKNIWGTNKHFCVHGDLALCNFIIDKGNINIIDWEHFHYNDVKYFGVDIANMIFISLMHEFKNIDNINQTTIKRIKKHFKLLFRESNSAIKQSPFYQTKMYLKEFEEHYKLNVPIEDKFVVAKHNNNELINLDNRLLD